MEDEFSEDLYWDLKELNPDAIIYTEYQEAFMGFALKNNKYVAVYDAVAIEEIIAKELLNEKEFLDKCFKNIDGKVERKDVPEALSRLAKIESISISSHLLGDWDGKENYPIMFFLPKVIQQMGNNGDEIFRYEQ